MDDDPSLRRSVSNLLGSAGFRVEVFESAEAFLASAILPQVGCLVLDLRMPAMSGLDLTLHLRDQGSAIPIVILTAHGGEDARARCLAAGVTTFLTKPFGAAELLRAVAAAMQVAPPK